MWLLLILFLLLGTDVLRREWGKFRKQRISHKFLSSVSLLRYHRKEYWVFVCVKKLDGSFIRLKNKKKLSERFIHISFFAPALPLLTRPTTLKTLPSLPQVISTDSVFTSIFFVIVCCLIIIINVINLYRVAALALHTAVEHKSTLFSILQRK